MPKLTNQSHLFKLDTGVHYLNCAYMSPLLKSVEKIGHKMVALKCRPYEISIDDFFDMMEKAKVAFAQLINAPEAGRIAIIPSVSYGIANVTKNIDLQKGENIVMPAEQFPSNYYSWKRLADEKGGQIKIIEAPNAKNRTEAWNIAILEAINDTTKVVTISHTHWADGTLFDLESIGKRCREKGALLIIDGTQSVGALPFDQGKIQADAIICAGYKWLLGPYSSGVAYYGKHFDNGIPIEENWINRHNSEDFTGLVNYQDQYKPLAGRYSVGEQSNFILTTMLHASLQQLLDWGVDNIQQYCQTITQKPLDDLQELGIGVENISSRAHHLFGLYPGKDFNMEKLKEKFTQERIFVSFRGNSIRVAPHVYNEEEDMNALVECFRSLK